MAGGDISLVTDFPRVPAVWIPCYLLDFDFPGPRSIKACLKFILVSRIWVHKNFVFHTAFHDNCRTWRQKQGECRRNTRVIASCDWNGFCPNRIQLTAIYSLLMSYPSIFLPLIWFWVWFAEAAVLANWLDTKALSSHQRQNLTSMLWVCLRASSRYDYNHWGLL